MLPRRLAFSCALLLMPLAQAQGVAKAQAAQGQGDERSYQIAPGPLGTALSQLADAAGVLFVADASLTRGKFSPGLQGRFGLRQAFEQVLQGSGLALTNEQGRYGLRAMAMPAQLQELPPVTAWAHAHERGYQSGRAEAAARTDTPLQDLPQSVTVLPRALLDDQSPRSMAEALRWVPGMGAAQGEGNRDTPVFRGISSTADFLVDGLRDDVQYYRDVYNIERIEVLKGPNAVLQGHGGVGGLINRVGKEPHWRTQRSLTLQAGTWAQRRATLDWDQRFSDTLAGRLNVMAEASNNWRDEFWMRRSGVNPVMSARLSRQTRVTVGLEHFEDERLADRGIPSWRGRPLDTGSGTFFGNPDASVSRARMDAASALLEHDLGEGRSLVNRTRHASYDKFFRNAFAGSLSPDGQAVSLSAHDSQTRRRNLFNQTDLTLPMRWGGWQHLVLTGVELGMQDGDNWRQTGFFPNGTRSQSVPVADSTSRLPVAFRALPNDPNTRSRSDTAALYLQDQIRWSPQWLAVLGLRHDLIDMRVLDRSLGRELSSRSHLWSPRAGLVYQPVPAVSLYLNHSIGYLPRAGEQLTSTLNNHDLRPEKYVNLEVGAKWTVHEGLDATAAAFQSRRSRVAVADPAAADLWQLVDGQRTRGLELGLSGALAPRWQVSGGYAYQDGRVLGSLSAAAQPGAVLPHLPRHSVALWNRWTLDARWATGLGVSYRGRVYTSTDNAVALPDYARVDGAVYYQHGPALKLQLNIENLLDQRYYAFAHSNNNITPGSPRALRLSLITGF